MDRWKRLVHAVSIATKSCDGIVFLFSLANAIVVLQCTDHLPKGNTNKSDNLMNVDELRKTSCSRM